MAVQEDGPECRDEFSSGSLAGSLASGSSGFGSLSKKRGPLFSSGVSFITVLISCLFHYSLLLSQLSDCHVCQEQLWLLHSVDVEVGLCAVRCVHDLSDCTQCCYAVSVIFNTDNFPAYYHGESICTCTIMYGEVWFFVLNSAH